MRRLAIWIVLGTLGCAVAGLMFHFPGSFPAGSGRSSGFAIDEAVFGAALGAVSGAVAGVLLWLGARDRASPWLIGAVALGFATTHALGDGLSASFDYLPIGIAGGTVLGIAVHRSLRQPPSRYAFLVSSALGFTAGLLAGIALADALGLMRQPWTPSLGMQQKTIASGLAGLFWTVGTGRHVFGRESAA